MKMCPDCKHVVLRPREPAYKCFLCGGTLVETNPFTGEIKKLPLSDTCPRTHICEVLGGKKKLKKQTSRSVMTPTDRPQKSIPKRKRKMDYKSQVLREQKNESKTREFCWDSKRGVYRRPGG